jgi:hypothetical protein
MLKLGQTIGRGLRLGLFVRVGLGLSKYLFEQVDITSHTSSRNCLFKLQTIALNLNSSTSLIFLHLFCSSFLLSLFFGQRFRLYKIYEIVDDFFIQA